MIVTVTPNPSLDVALHVDELRRGAVLRATAERHDAGGKGLNVSRALAANGVENRAVMPLGGSAGADLLALLAGDTGLEPVAVPIAGSTRSNVGLVEPDGTLTKINAAGPVLTREELAAFRAAVLGAADGAAWVVLAGSLPKGLSDDFYASLIEPLQALGARVALDSSGPAFERALAAGPDLVKPNVHELAEVLGRRLRTVGDLIDGAAELRARGPRTVLASAGPDGAVAVDERGATHGEPPPIVPASSVGAGDAMLAGWLAATEYGRSTPVVPGSGGAASPVGEAPDTTGEAPHLADAAASGPGRPSRSATPGHVRALAAALAWGAGAAALPGSRMPGPTHLHPEGVRTHAVPDRDRVLEEEASPATDPVAASTTNPATTTEGPVR